MLTFSGLAILLSAGGAVVTALLAIAFLRDPEAGLVQTTHHREQLPQVMTDRYVAFTGLALFATLYGDMAVIAALFTAFAFMGYADAWIYRRAGQPIAKHLTAGIAATIVVVAALFAYGAA